MRTKIRKLSQVGLDILTSLTSNFRYMQYTAEFTGTMYWRTIQFIAFVWFLGQVADINTKLSQLSAAAEDCRRNSIVLPQIVPGSPGFRYDIRHQYDSKRN